MRFRNELERNITIKLGYANAKIYKCDNAVRSSHRLPKLLVCSSIIRACVLACRIALALVATAPSARTTATTRRVPAVAAREPTASSGTSVWLPPISVAVASSAD